VLRFRVEETASICGRQPRIYSISSRGQPTRGRAPAWGLSEEQTMSHHKIHHVVQMYSLRKQNGGGGGGLAVSSSG
jgi:hypothetical protein